MDGLRLWHKTDSIRHLERFWYALEYVERKRKTMNAKLFLKKEYSFITAIGIVFGEHTPNYLQLLLQVSSSDAAQTRM